jgi:hypothetical protein
MLAASPSRLAALSGETKLRSIAPLTPKKSGEVLGAVRGVEALACAGSTIAASDSVRAAVRQALLISDAFTGRRPDGGRHRGPLGENPRGLCGSPATRWEPKARERPRR